MVVSPHSDDAVLSLGATIASWVGRGAVVELLTVLALDPESEAPAGGWDERAYDDSGERSAGHPIRERQIE